MKKIVDQAIVLRRVNYGEKDRVVTLLCADLGKITVFAKGARAQKSKLSGGIELLSVSEVTVLEGKGGLNTLVGANLQVHFSEIVKDHARMTQAFEALKLVQKMVEDGTGQDFFDVIVVYFTYLNKRGWDAVLVEIWFSLHILEIAGFLAEIEVDNATGEEGEIYIFDDETHHFLPSENGNFTQNDIKLMRILKDSNKPLRVAGSDVSGEKILGLSRNLILTSF